MIAAIYCRVSTEEQAQEGFSISAQITLINAYCKQHNIEVYKIYIDEGISGTKENRPQFQAMINDGEKRLFNIILVHKFDRFARKVELSQRIKNQLKKCDIQVISITEPLEDSPMGFFVGGLHDLLAEYYIRNLSQEVKKGQIERARQGKHSGPVPYGYTTNGENMIIEPAQAKIVQWIYDMYTKEGMSSVQITNRLNENSIPAPISQKWNHRGVQDILKNIKYIGKIYYDKEIYEGMHEAIISEDQFNLAQKAIKNNTVARAHIHSNYSKFVFLGLLRCGYCKRNIRIHHSCTSPKVNRKTLLYYICTSHKYLKEPCTNKKYYPVYELERKIETYLKTLNVKTLSQCNIIDKTDINEILQNRKEKINTELNRAKQAYLTGVFTLEEYADIKNKIEKDLNIIDENIKAENNKEKAKKLLIKIVALMKTYDDAKTVMEKKNILKQFIDTIYITQEGIHMVFVL